MVRKFMALSLIIIFLSSCTNSSLLPNKPIQEIVITNLDDGKTYHIEDNDAIITFEEAFSNLEKLDGISNIKTKDYQITFYYEDEEKPLLMWLSDNSGIVMEPNNNEECYIIQKMHVDAIHTLDWK